MQGRTERAVCGCARTAWGCLWVTAAVAPRKKGKKGGGGGRKGKKEKGQAGGRV